MCAYGGDKKTAGCPRGRAWIELHMDNLRHNVEALKALLPPGCELMPALKANAYGHGAVLIAGELNKLGIHAFCVATAAEGAALRRNHIAGDILILGYTHPEDFHLLNRYELTQTVLDYDYARILSRYGRSVRVQVCIDTGMHRLGERWENIARIRDIFYMKNLRVEGIFTHLSAADTDTPEARAYTQKQGMAFRQVVEELGRLGLTCPKVHLLNSDGLLHYPELGGSYARVGIALYGVCSTREDEKQSGVDLRPVLSVKARVSSVKKLHKDEYAGYGMAYTAKAERKIAVLAIGYADGLPRSLSCETGGVLIKGCMAPIIGRICMDQTLVDVTGIPHVGLGDIATVIGADGGTSVTVYDVAEQTGTITNEVLSRLGTRLERMAV